MPAGEPPASRTIRLLDRGGRLTFQRAASANGGPEPLPRVPLTLVHWCGLAGERFFRRQRRCLLILLMLDTSLRRWTYLLPTQCCSRHVARWDGAADQAFDRLPDHLLLAGSFQSAPPGNVNDALYLPPAFDGIHLVAHRSSGSRLGAAWTFVRREGEWYVGDPSMLIGDDVDQALSDAAERIQLDG